MSEHTLRDNTIIIQVSTISYLRRNLVIYPLVLFSASVQREKGLEKERARGARKREREGRERERKKRMYRVKRRYRDEAGARLTALFFSL